MTRRIMMPRTLKLRVPGSTSNLGAGFDTLGLALDLPLEVVFHFEVDRTAILAVRGEGPYEIAKVEDHLVLQAWQRACRELGRPAPSVALEIDNKIPLRRGLGSSGAAIVAGLLAAQIFFGNALSRQQMLALACELEGHPENASASLLGGLTVNGVANGRVFCERFAPPGNWAAACFIPELEMATAAARRVLPASLPRHEAVGNVQSAAMMVAAFAKANPEVLAFAARDFIHQPFRKALIPGFEVILDSAMQNGAYCAFLSGSGSTLLAIADRDRAPDVSLAMAQTAQAHGLSGRPQVLPFAAQGASWEDGEEA